MKRPLALIGFTYMTMLTVANFIPESILIYILIILIVIFAILCAISTYRNDKTIIIFFATAIISFSVYILHYNLKVLPILQLNDKDCTINGYICETPRKINGRYSYIIKVNSVENYDISEFKIAISSNSSIDADLYDKIIAKSHMYVPENYSNFNSKLYYKSKDVYLKGYLYEYDEMNIIKYDNSHNFNYKLHKFREKILSANRVMFPGDEAEILNGILLGEKNNISQELKESFKIIGIYHILATSGLHITILSQFILLVLKKVKTNRILSYGFTILVVIFFMTIANFTPSVMRAGIMTIIYLVGAMLFRQADAITSLGVAVLLICAFSPNYSIDMGLWFSFLSTLGLILFSNNINSFIKTTCRINSEKFNFVRYILSGISSSIAVAISTIPLIIMTYKTISVISIFSNILLLFPITILLNVLLIVDILYICCVPKTFLKLFIIICDIISDYLVLIADTLSKISYATISIDSFYLKLCFAFLFIAVGILILFRIFRSMIKKLCLMSANIFLMAIILDQIFNYNLINLSVLDARDGCCIVISKNYHNCIIMCGGENLNVSSISNYLISTNAHNIDYIIFPKSDNNVVLFTKKLSKKYEIGHIVINKQNKSFFFDKNDNFYDKIVIFTHFIQMNFWNDVNAKIYKIDNKLFILLKIWDTKILICPEGGDVLHFPKEFKNINFLIAGYLPNQYNKINFDKIILSSSHKFEKNLYNRIPIYSVLKSGAIVIKVNQKNEYIMNRRG